MNGDVSGDYDNAFMVTEQTTRAGVAWAACVWLCFMGNIKFVCLRQKSSKSPESFRLLIGGLVFNKTVNYLVSPREL